MERLSRPMVAFGLGLLITSSGCRSTRNEVPPGRPYAKDGQQRKAIEFSSDGHPVSAAAGVNLMPNNLGGSNMASGIGSNASRPDGSAMVGSGGSFGPPGNAGLAQPGSNDPSITRASGGSLGTPPADLPPPGSISPAPAASSSSLPDVAPRGESPPMESPTAMPSVESPGAMGSPAASPGPN